MKKFVALLLVLAAVCALAGCGSETTALEASCGHEPYEELIIALDNQDYDAARKMIDEMEGVSETISAETAAPETASAQTDAPAMQTGSDIILDAEVVTLDRYNLLDYFELREDYIFEDTVKCYQYFLLREEYEKRLVDIQDVTIEISGFDSIAYGELDYGDQLFFPGSYEMTTGDLMFRNVYITNNGEGHISLSEYNEQQGCFSGYMMDIAVTEVTGSLILETE